MGIHPHFSQDLKASWSRRCARFVLKCLRTLSNRQGEGVWGRRWRDRLSKFPEYLVSVNSTHMGRVDAYSICEKCGLTRISHTISSEVG